ncbi:MAG: hypothetical protein R3B09_27560 [Nannocystaceae bacterium]
MRLSAALVLALAPLACSTSGVFQMEDAAAGPIVCEESAVALASADAEALGFSVDDVLTRFGGPREETLEWYEGESVGLTLDLKALGAAELVTSSYPEGVEPGDEPDLSCGATWMRLRVGLDFKTSDGALDEVLEQTWELTALEDFASVIVDLPLAEVAGTYASEAQFLSFNVTLGESESWGSVVGVIPSDDGLGVEFNVARFNQSTWPQTP